MPYLHSLSSKEGTFLDARGEVTDKVMINSATLTLRQSITVSKCHSEGHKGIKTACRLFPCAPRGHQAVCDKPSWAVGKHRVDQCCSSTESKGSVPSASLTTEESV